MQRGVRIAQWSVGIILLVMVLLVCAVWMAGNTDPGRRVIERVTASVTQGHVKLSGLSGSFPSDLAIGRLELSDDHGVWLDADSIALRWSPLDLLMRSIHVDRLHISRLHVERTPVSGEAQKGGKTSVPHVVVAQLSIDAVELGAPLVGTPATLSLQGSGRLRSLDDAIADLVARRLNGEGNYTLHLNIDRRRMDVSVTLHEPAGGPLEHLIQLPGLGALSATVTMQGLRSAEKVSLVLDAGELSARAQGSIDLLKASADLEFALASPALKLRPDVEWQRLDVRGTWSGPLQSGVADGQIKVVGLKLAGATQIAGFAANVAAKEGTLSLAAQADGVQIPGPEARLFAADPFKITASLGLKDSTLPLSLVAAHRLLSLKAQATLAGDQQATMALRLPDLAPFAALGGQDVRGDADIKARVTRHANDTSISLDATAGLVGGGAGWVDMAGPRVALQLSGVLSPEKIDIDKLHLAARALNLSASGDAQRSMTAGLGFADSIKELKARWDLDLADLALLSPDVKGRLKATGRVSGPLNAISGEASLTSTLSVRDSPSGTIDAKVHAQGLPGAPSGSFEAHGMFDGAPLQVSVLAERRGGTGVRVAVRQLDWKSAHAGGDVTVGASLGQAHGQFQLHLGQLGDLDRLLGSALRGSLDGSGSIVPGNGSSIVRLDLDGKDLATGQISGGVQLKAAGTLDALGLQLDAQMPSLGGLPAKLSAAAQLNSDARVLRLASAVLDYRGQSLKLQSPAAVSFKDGVTIDQLRLGLQQATFELSGRLTPTLDIRAALAHVKPALVNAFAPGLLADGTLEARAQLQGTLAEPTGRVQLDATGIRLADDAATGLPSVDVHLRSQLGDHRATVDGRLVAAGGSSSMTATGSVPLDAQGALNLKLAGDLDLTLANPLLEARGLHASGKVAVDAAVSGSSAAPKIGGSITLANGNVRDYARGINLSDISANVAGSESGLEIKAFRATAGTGSVTMTGSVGLLQPQLPIDLKITAKNAQPIASSIVTASMDADVSVKGNRHRLDVDGTVHVSHAVIGIPNSLPPDVAVLDVRRRGKTAAAQADNALIVAVDIDVQAPREILIQGRGLDAEMGGDIHIAGTTDALTASGGFTLQRGSFSLAGNKLNFTDGRVGFDGAGLRKKIDPTLDFTAQTVVTDTTITLKIAGFADAPRFELSSAPPRGQDEIMGYLLFGGQSVDKLSALQVAQVGAALATLSGVGGSSTGPLAKIQKSLGLDRLNVGSGTKETATGTENSGAAIQAGRYVSKRVYIEGKQSTTGSSQVQVDVDLTKHLKLQTRLGTGGATQGTTPETDPGSSVGLSYQFEY